MSTKYNRIIKAIVIHHMGDGLPPTVPISQRWNPFGYDTPEYDFGIEFDGTIRNGRPLTVQGAHCLSDKPPYSQKGDQWWNKNSIGIGIAGDFTKYPMPQAQFNGLVKLVKDLMKQYNLTLDNIYPHGQTTYTDCPGCTYSKVPALKGMWNYDDFEKAVNNKSNTTIQSINNNQGDEFKMEHAVFYFTERDFSVARMISSKLKDCAIYCRNGINANIHLDIKNVKHPIFVGGAEYHDNSNTTNCCGEHDYDTFILASNYAKTL